MKRLYFLLIGLCLLSQSAFAQTININATGATGSYKTGYTQATTGRTDGNMTVTNSTPRRGYAVFDLSALPSGATITNVSLRFNFTTSGGGTNVACAIYGYPGDLSTVTAAATLWADCANGTAFNTTNWGAAVGGSQDNLPLGSGGASFVQTNIGSKVSIGFVASSNTNMYTI